MSRKSTSFGKLPLMTIAAAAMAFATTASADSVRLIRPSQAATLSSGGIGMTVYYIGQSSPLELVATFGDRKSSLPASQLRMSLADGDNIEFFIPGRSDVSFQFARTGSLIEVSSNPVDSGS